MDMDEEAEAILARIRMVRDDLDAGRLSRDQVLRYRQLGREVERITRQMDIAADPQVAESLWTTGAELIRTFLNEHFPAPTRH